MVLVSPFIKICEFFFFSLLACRRHVEEAKKKKKKEKETLAGHQNPASRTRSSVRHVSDTDTTPKMACPCNLEAIISPNSCIHRILRAMKY